MTNKLMIYPFGKETSPIARHCDMLSYTLTHLVSPIGSGYCGQEACVADGGEATGFIVQQDFDACMSECDVILFALEPSNLNQEHFIQHINKALDQGKEVLITPGLKQFLDDDISKLADKITVLYQDFYRPKPVAKTLSKSINKSSPILDEAKKILPINIPVVMIMGVGDYCNKFDIHLSISDFFQKEGYTVSQLGTKDYCSLFGFHQIPHFVFEDINLTQRIIGLNNYIYRKIKQEQPDIFIISVPGGIMSIDEDHHNNFGGLPFIITNAVRPDITICSTYHNIYTAESFENQINFCRYRLNSEVEYINIANTKLNIEQESWRELTYLTLSSDYVLNSITEEMAGDDYILFNALDKNSMNTVCDQILTQLNSNIAVI